MKVLVWLLISLLWSLICSKFINKQYVCRWIRLKTKALEIRNALIKAHLVEIWKGQNIIKTTKYLSQEENVSLIKILPKEHCKPISLCTNSHREIPVMNTGSLQWEQGFPVMKTGFSLWELVHRENPVLALYWFCTGPIRDCSVVNDEWFLGDYFCDIINGSWCFKLTLQFQYVQMKMKKINWPHCDFLNWYRTVVTGCV